MTGSCAWNDRELSVPVFRRRQAGVGLEELVEDGLVGEVELDYDFLDGHIGVFQQVFRFQDHEFVDPVGGGAAGGLLDQFGEVFGSEAQFVRVEGHPALGTVVLVHEGDETLEYLVQTGVVLGCGVLPG